MSMGHREFHLFVDCLSVTRGDLDAGAEAQEPRQPFVVPGGVSCLRVSRGGDLTVAPKATGQGASARLVVEPVETKRQPYLVLISQGYAEVRINGQMAPSFALLREKDQVQVGDDVILHVALFNRPSIGTVPEEQVGKECPVCRVPFAARTRVYLCANCGSALHLQSDEEPETTRLECALAVTECPVCQQPIEMTAGYRYEPELYSV